MIETVVVTNNCPTVSIDTHQICTGDLCQYTIGTLTSNFIFPDWTPFYPYCLYATYSVQYDIAPININSYPFITFIPGSREF